jgi:hypothetical protein
LSLLQSTIEALAAAGAGADRTQARAAFEELKAALEKGTVRSCLLKTNTSPRDS